MRNILSAAIATIGDTSGGHRSEREAVGLMAAWVRTGYLTVQAREDGTQSHTLTADEASKQRVISGRPRVAVMQATDLGDSDDFAL